MTDVRQTKGLEFDEVVLLETTAASYPVTLAGATRALRRRHARVASALVRRQPGSVRAGHRSARSRGGALAVRPAGARRVTRAAWACGALCAIAAEACHKETVVTVREVSLHAPARCAPGVPSLDGNAYGVFQPLGDFEPPASAAGHPLGDVGAALPELDPAARAIVVDATERDRRWQGEVGVGQAGPIDLLLLPTLTSCALSHTLDAGARTGPALAAVGSERVLVVGGVASTPPRTLLVRLDTGEIQPREPGPLDATHGCERHGVRTRGARRRRLRFPKRRRGPRPGRGLRPGPGRIRSATPHCPQHAARKPRSRRARHGRDAPGGRGRGGRQARARFDGNRGSCDANGPRGERRAPRGRAKRADRSAPRVGRESSSQAASTPAATPCPPSSGSRRMPAMPRSAQETSWRDRLGPTWRSRPEVPSRSSRLPRTLLASFQNTWLIDPDGVFEPTTPIAGAVAQPVLFGGAGGAPVLWTGDRWLRWAPWTGSFEALDVLDDTRARDRQRDGVTRSGARSLARREGRIADRATVRHAGRVLDAARATSRFGHVGDGSGPPRDRRRLARSTLGPAWCWTQGRARLSWTGRTRTSTSRSTRRPGSPRWSCSVTISAASSRSAASRAPEPSWPELRRR